MNHPLRHSQQGVFLIEALIAILIFALGILGMVSMGSAAVSSQSDSQYRTEAVNHASEIASKIALNVDRSPGMFGPSLLTFQHQPTTTGYCTFTGDASSNAIVTTWLGKLTGAGGLPGATTSSESIEITASPSGDSRRLTVTVCWRPPAMATGAPWHRQVLVSYIN